MSYAYWSVHGHELKEEVIKKEIAPKAYKAFMDALDSHEIDIAEYAKYKTSRDLEELAFGDYKGEDVNATADILDALFEKLSREIEDETNIKIDLVYPGGNIEYGEDRVYWEISNATIHNPVIHPGYFPDSYFEVIAGG